MLCWAIELQRWAGDHFRSRGIWGREKTRQGSKDVCTEIEVCTMPVHWKDWCWSWNSNPLVTSREELTHWKTPYRWERLGAGGEGDNRGWDGWMASPTRWTWVWVNSGSWWWTGRPGVLRFMGSQRVRHDWATELNWTMPDGVQSAQSRSRAGDWILGDEWRHSNLSQRNNTCKGREIRKSDLVWLPPGCVKGATADGTGKISKDIKRSNCT